MKRGKTTYHGTKFTYKDETTETVLPTPELKKEVEAMINPKKYRTPELHEFKIGFEFESNHICYRKSLEDWAKCTIETKEDLEMLTSLWHHDAYDIEFRVEE